jgi:two-component system, OmpR family, response regulator
MSGRRVLFVDDDPDIRRIGRLALGATGWQVTLVESGNEALEWLRRNPVDVVLLDVMMPGLDGPETLSLLQGDPQIPDVPVVFLTACSEPAEAAELHALGARAVFAKPFDPMGLGQRLGEVLSRS